MESPTVEVLSIEIRHERELREELARRLDERNTANEHKAAAALKAQKEATAAAFNAAERAIMKAETAQHAHNLAANEWRATLENHAARQITRVEADTRFESIEDKIDSLKGALNDEIQKRTAEALTLARGNATWTRGAMLTAFLSLIGWGITVVLFLAP